MLNRSASIGLFILSVCASQAAGQTPTPQNDATADGLEFNDPLIGRCMALVREGKADDAVARLKKEIAESPGRDPARTGELKLGLAMIYLRTSQKAKARNLLTPMVAQGSRDSISMRANILLRIAERGPRFRKAKEEWSSTEGWQAALASVVQD